MKDIEKLITDAMNALTALPVEVFAALGSFLEEVIAPIPSPFVMTTAAVIAQEQGYTLPNYVLLIVLGAIGKTLGAAALYVFADKSEDVLFGKFGKYLGITHDQIEKVGKWFSKGVWDEVLIFTLRAIPFTPSGLLSIAAGFIKVNFRSFILMTFLGSMVRNGFYLLIGTYGWGVIQNLI